jgi:DDE superfamily endonuclease
MERAVSRHKGQREFESGELDENFVENGEETHFIMNMDNGKTLAAINEKSIKYADVVPGGVGMTMFVRLSGGSRSQSHPAFMVFQSAGSYPIRGVDDIVPGVAYRVGKRGWMDRRVLAEYSGESRAIWPLPAANQRVLFLDNCGGHNETADSSSALRKIRRSIRFLPRNSTHLTQPCDSFEIQKFNEEWSRRWDADKVAMVQSGKWKNGEGSPGKLINPGKRYFLQLAADCIKAVNNMKDKNGLSWSRKVMIRCGLSLGLNGQWGVNQLSPELPEIIKKYPNEFCWD